MKRKKLSSLIGGVLAVAFMLSMIVSYGPGASAAATYEALNPLGRIDAPYNQPLAARDGAAISAKTVGLVDWKAYTDGTGRFSGGAPFMTALKTLLGADAYVEKTIDLHFEQAQSWYDDLAGAVDAVVFAVAEDNTTAYWGALHVREMEERGVPAAIVVSGRFEETLRLAAEDQGITALRSVVLSQRDWGGFYSGLVTAATLAGLAAPGVAAALTDALTAAEISPAVIVPQNVDSDLSFEADSYLEATRIYNDKAIELGISDGLPLTLPTRIAVDEMLAATDRAPDEVLGKIRMRNGICTVEKLAINAVMAGAMPQYFPVIIAAMEVIAQGAEDHSYFYHALTTGDDYSLILILNGPISDELGMVSNRGYLGAERPANNTIGRAVKLAIRNIGFNIAPYVDTAMSGRINDHTLIVVSENESPYGRPGDLEPHHVSLGYDKTQSTVTVLAAGPWSANDLTCVTTDPYTYRMAPSNAGTFSLNRTLTTGSSYNVGVDAMGFSMLKTRFSGATGSTAYSWNININMSLLPQGSALAPGEDVVAFFLTPGQAKILTLGYGQYGLNDTGDKTAIQDWFVRNGVNGVRFAAHNQVPQIFVIGEEPSYIRAFKSTGYGMNAYRTQLITGATVTAAGQDAAAPSQPLNFRAYFTAADEVTLAWDAPTRADGDFTYEVSCDDGVNWINVGAANSYVVAGYTEDCRFVVRAVSDNDNSRVFAAADLTDRGSGRGAQARTVAVPITSLKINASAMLSMPRNSSMQLGVILNDGAHPDALVWAVSNTSYATVDENGFVKVKNLMGTVTLTAKDPVSGTLNTIVIRIT